MTDRAPKTPRKPAKPRQPLPPTADGKPRLLSGGNPQIPKGDGDGPVQAYIEAMPGWKQTVGRQLDDLVTRLLPDVRKQVKWNTPFYGAAGDTGWFLAVHCYTKKVNLSFLRGAALDPVPPGSSKMPDVRYFDITETDPFDAARLETWIRQSAALPGAKL